MKLHVIARVRKAKGNPAATVLDQVFRFMRRLTRHFEEFNLTCDNPKEDTPEQQEYRKDVHTWMTELEKIEKALKAEQVSENPDNAKIKELADKLVEVRGQATQIASKDHTLGKLWNQVFQKVSTKHRVGHIRLKSKVKKYRIAKTVRTCSQCGADSKSIVASDGNFQCIQCKSKV